MLKRPEVFAVRETYHGSLLVTLACFKSFSKGCFSEKSLVKSEQSGRFQPEKFLNIFKHVSY